jgi:hypothetical protein
LVSNAGSFLLEFTCAAPEFTPPAFAYLLIDHNHPLPAAGGTVDSPVL